LGVDEAAPERGRDDEEDALLGFLSDTPPTVRIGALVDEDDTSYSASKQQANI
jgi:hypothetical protein